MTIDSLMHRVIESHRVKWSRHVGFGASMAAINLNECDSDPMVVYLWLVIF